MRYQLKILVALAVAQAGCSMTPGAQWPTSQRNSNVERDYYVGNVESEFVLTGEGVRILYADRAGDSQAARDRAGDAIAETLMSQRGGRVALGGLYTSNPSKVATFSGLIRNVLFSVYCKGYCKSLVLRMRTLGGRSMAGSVRPFYPLPAIEVVNPTYYPDTVTFELDAESSDLSHYSEITVTQWESKTWNHRSFGG